MQGRIFYLDSMRGVLILFIVMIHAMQVFNPNKTWKIFSEASIEYIPYIIDFFLLFTLTSFYIMSGYFAMMTIDKIGSDKFLKMRITRILIPIFVTAVTLNTIQSYLLVKNGWMNFNIAEYIENGIWVSHLWFLINLVIYFFLLYLFVQFLKKNKIKLFSIEKVNIYFYIFFMSLLVVFLLVVVSIISPYWKFGNIIDLHALVFYFVFFLFGVFMYTNQKILDKVLNIPITKLILFIVLSISLSRYFNGDEDKVYKALYFFFNTSAKFFSSILCIKFFYIFFNEENKILKKLSESSYTIYLVHHVFIIAIGLILIKYHIEGILGFFILFLLAVFISLSIHFLIISKVPILSFLFNGKYLEKDKLLK